MRRAFVARRRNLCAKSTVLALRCKTIIVIHAWITATDIHAGVLFHRLTGAGGGGWIVDRAVNQYRLGAVKYGDSIFFVSFVRSSVKLINKTELVSLSVCRIISETIERIWIICYWDIQQNLWSKFGFDPYLFIVIRLWVVPGSLSPGVKRPGREADHSCSSSDEVMNDEL
jgi:hypothetical protein